MDFNKLCDEILKPDHKYDMLEYTTRKVAKFLKRWEREEVECLTQSKQKILLCMHT